jgi:hypothetical protein
VAAECAPNDAEADEKLDKVLRSIGLATDMVLNEARALGPGNSRKITCGATRTPSGWSIVRNLRATTWFESASIHQRVALENSYHVCLCSLGGARTMPTINSEASPIAIAIAGGAIAIALLDNLIERGVLTTENGRDVLAEAQRRLVAFTNNADVSEADRVISCLFQGMPNHSGYSTL